MVKMIKPRPIRVVDVTKAVDLGLKATDAECEANFKLTYWSWDQENWPEWEVIGPRTKGGNRELIRQTEDTPYTWTDLGTKEHPIDAKNAPFLKFKSGFLPKTQPGRLTAQAGASFGDWISTKHVDHPGTKPRKFSEQVAEKADDVIMVHMDHYLGGV